MSRTFAAAALGSPVLNSTALPEREGTALRLHVAPVMTAIWSDGSRGYALLPLCPRDDPDEPADLVRLPLMQCEVLKRACAAFDCIMSAARAAAGPGTASTPPIAPRLKAVATAAEQVVVLAAFLPAVAGRCLGLF